MIGRARARNQVGETGAAAPSASSSFTATSRASVAEVALQQQAAVHSATASGANTISNYNQRPPEGCVLADPIGGGGGDNNNEPSLHDEPPLCHCVSLQRPNTCEQARADRPTAAELPLTIQDDDGDDGRLSAGSTMASSSLSSGADLNCRRSPASGGRQLQVEYCAAPPPLARPATDKKQEVASAAADERAGLFKRAASCLWAATTKRPVWLPLTYRATAASRSGGGAKVRTSLVELDCAPIKASEQPHQQQQQQQHHLQRRLGKTIKSLVVASGGSDWSRSFNRRPPPNEPINGRSADPCHPAAGDIVKLARTRQDADSFRTDTVVVLSSSSSSSSSNLLGSRNTNQNKTSGRLLPNSVSCELPFVRQQQKSSPAALVDTTTRESNNVFVGEQFAAETQAEAANRSRRKRRRIRRSPSAQRVATNNKTKSNKSIAGSNMSAGRADQATNNLARKKDLADDRACRRLQQQQQHQRQTADTDTKSSSSSFQRQHQFDERRSTICSSIGGLTDIHDDDVDCNSCDFSSSMAAGGATKNNDNNNNDLGVDPVESNSMKNCLNLDKEARENDRQGNSNDCKNPSQGQPAASAALNDIQRQRRNNNNKRRQQNADAAATAAAGGGGGHDSGGASRAGECRITNLPAGIGMKKRENWSMNIEFLLAVIGFAVDLGNIWRFPYICYKNGGGAFLIPYTIMFILGGLPIFYLEMSLGQYFSSGCLTVWARVCPAAKGIGYAMVMLNFYTGLYYNTIISWAVFFFVESFSRQLPWTSCDNLWNTADCKTIDQRQALKSIAYNATAAISSSLSNLTSSVVAYSSPTKDYFEREVLRVHLSKGIDDPVSIRTPLAIYLAIVFVCIYFAIWKGVRSTGKAVWITALLPYFVLIPLLIRGIFLEGAWLGIRYYLEPQWEKIFDVNVWVEAAKQIYFSLGPGFGTLLALSSYNKFHHNCRRDAFIAAFVNYFASFIAGLVVFALLGYMATIMDTSISEVATEGPGLVFQVYPEGLATMRFSSMWSVLFFIMVITLGIDSTFGGLESVITGLCDEYPLLRAHRGTFIGILIAIIYFCSLPTTTYGGNYAIYLIESYGTSLSLIFIVLAETIVVCWIYGTDKFCSNLEEMYGERPGPFWRICWKYISPTILLLIFLAACVQEFDKYFILKNENYIYPSWAPIFGLILTGSSVCLIPIYIVYYFRTKTSGTFCERLKIATRPEEDTKLVETGIYGDAMIDRISDENDIHLNVVI